MKNINKKSTSLSGFCLIMLTVLFSVTQAQTVADKRPALRTNLGLSSVLWLNDRTLADYNIQKESTLDLFAINPDQVTVTHKREIKLPVRLRNVINLALNDSGLGATDLDQTQQILWKQRFLVMHNRLYAMHEGADGTAYYGTTRQSDVESALTSVVERHINTNSSFPTFGSLFGMIGLSIRYNLINSNAQVLDRWLTGLPSARTIGYGGAGTSIICTAESYQLNGVSTRLASINQNTRETTSFSGDVVEQTGKSIGGWMTIAYGADDLLYLFDYENLRILKFDTGVLGGTRGAFLGAFDLDPTKPAINSMTVDPAGNVYIGSDNGGFHIYGGDGQWKQSVEGIYQTDPNSDVPALAAGYKPYMNYYASGLNDGNGTLDVRDSTGYRQYTITAPGQTPPIRITSEPQSQTIQQSSATNLSVSANGNGEPLTYQWRKNGVTLTDGGTVSGATTANLNISSTAAGDAGYYDVLVRKPGAIVTSQAAIIIVQLNTSAPVSTASSSSTPNTSGWYNQDVSVSLSAADEINGSGVKQITYSATGAQTIASTTVTANSALVPSITSEGTTVISYYATDNAGNNETAQTVTIKLDKTAPSVQCGSVSTQWLSADASISCNSSDSVSGLESSTNASFTLTTAVPANTETNNALTDSRQVCDIAGNCSTAGPVTGNMIDKKSASISISSRLASTYQRNQLVTAQYSCADGGSGVATCSGPVASGSFIDTSTTGTKTFTVTSTDNVGNSANQTITYTVVNNPPSGTPTADLSISMTSDAPKSGVETGSNISYTITLLNKGPNAATDVFITDEIPTGTSFVSATGDYTLVSGGTTGNKLVVNAGTLNSGDSVSITLVVKVNAASGSRINNSALASTSTFDSVTRNNTVTLSTKVSR